LRCIMPD
ncbi:hypothetical protein VCHENC02_3447B, partial [Vibrio harveyi]